MKNKIMCRRCESYVQSKCTDSDCPLQDADIEDNGIEAEEPLNFDEDIQTNYAEYQSEEDMWSDDCLEDTPYYDDDFVTDGGWEHVDPD